MACHLQDIKPSMFGGQSFDPYPSGVSTLGSQSDKSEASKKKQLTRFSWKHPLCASWWKQTKPYTPTNATHWHVRLSSFLKMTIQKKLGAFAPHFWRSVDPMWHRRMQACGNSSLRWAGIKLWWSTRGALPFTGSVTNVGPCRVVAPSKWNSELWIKSNSYISIL